MTAIGARLSVRIYVDVPIRFAWRYSQRPVRRRGREGRVTSSRRGAQREAGSPAPDRGCHSSGFGRLDHASARRWRLQLATGGSWQRQRGWASVVSTALAGTQATNADF